MLYRALGVVQGRARTDLRDCVGCKCLFLADSVEKSPLKVCENLHVHLRERSRKAWDSSYSARSTYSMTLTLAMRHVCSIVEDLFTAQAQFLRWAEIGLFQQNQPLADLAPRV
jgi:hypothetical protein